MKTACHYYDRIKVGSSQPYREKTKQGALPILAQLRELVKLALLPVSRMTCIIFNGAGMLVTNPKEFVTNYIEFSKKSCGFFASCKRVVLVLFVALVHAIPFWKALFPCYHVLD